MTNEFVYMVEVRKGTSFNDEIFFSDEYVNHDEAVIRLLELRKVHGDNVSLNFKKREINAEPI